MATEYIQKSYYDDEKSKFVDIHQSIKIAIESFLVSTLFKGDLKRVVYCKKDIAFRRRVELVDSDRKDFTSISPISLQLPFACFSKETEFENDETKGLIAPAALIGQESYESGWIIRNLPVKATYKVTAFFSRQDDLRLAHQVMYWEATPEAPIWIQVETLYKDGTIAIPCFMKITDINSSPDYAEKDWLEKSRIFPLEISIDVYSYQLAIPNVGNIIRLPLRWQKYNNEAEREQDNFYIVEKAVLAWANKKFDLISESNAEIKPTVIEDKKLFKPDYRTLEQLSEDMQKALPNETTADLIDGYFADTYEVQFTQIFVLSSTPTSVEIFAKINPSSAPNFDFMEIVTPGRPPITCRDTKQTNFVIEGLYPNSEYTTNILVHSTTGVITTFNLTYTTPDTPDNQAPTKNNPFKEGNLYLNNKPLDEVTKTELTIDDALDESEIKEDYEEPCKDIKPPVKRKGNSLEGFVF